ncbi:unnamed protein product [Miscanthus lutarioriparius]|uniref:Uncharacterized protein n=1 Tax=Miscanthus lutarioriparius TaxID=422564 RepID=A0A811N0Q4_9POAL|nr:unnamed protein product [Miscanthus lutarioriparius]
MEIDECRKLLLNKALQINARNAQRFVDYIVSHRLPAEIRQYSSASIQQLRSLFCEVMNYLEAHPPRQEIDMDEYRKLLLNKTLQIDARNAQRDCTVFIRLHSQLPLQKPPSWGHGHGLQFPQPQLHPSSSFPGNQAQVPLPHGQPQFDPRFSFNRIQPPFFPFSPIETVHRGQLLFYPSSSIDGIQPPLLPIGQIGQTLPQIRPSANFNEMQPPFPPNVHSNALQSADRNASLSVAGDSSRRSQRCYNHFNGGCQNHKCQYCHWSYLAGLKYELPNHSLETLPLLGEEIRQLLISQRPSVVPIEHLPMIYFAKYGKSLFVTDFKPEVRQLGEKGSYSLICLLMRLDTIKVIESDGQQCDSKLVLAPPNPRHRVTIYIAFSRQSTFTEVLGATSGATRGWVSFLYPETVELLLSETRSNRHLILGALVHIFSSMEKLEWKVSGQEESDKVSDVNVSYEHHIGEKSSSELEPSPEKLNNECDKVISADKSSSTVAHGMASEGDNAVESSDLSNRSDKASADQDIDDSGLQDDLAID